MMLTILKYTNNRILVTAETNLAVDNLLLRFFQGNDEEYNIVRVRRLSDEGKQHKVLKNSNLENLVRRRVNLKMHQHFHLSLYKKTVSEVLEESRVVFTTCAGAGDPVLSKLVFQSVIMDEASMTTEAGALCALVHGCCHLILIGDHKQLGPHANGGNCQSLFERLSNPRTTVRAKTTFLCEQHRMHPKLCLFPSREFYDGRLLTAPNTEEARVVPTVFFGGESPFRFIDVDGLEERIGNGSWYNEKEADTVLKVLSEFLHSDELTPTEITVLTFYRAQQMKLRERLLNWRWPTIEVSTVDGYQGKENEVIVLSVVRSRDSLGFCDDPRRSNVVLTRAKRGLVVIGRRETLKMSPLWAKWLKEAT